MTAVAHALRLALENALQPSVLHIVNESHLHAGHAEAGDGGESHFRLVIASDALNGLPKVAQHRLIYKAVGGLMPYPVHALVIEVLYSHSSLELDSAAND
jgi:BolA protein